MSSETWAESLGEVRIFVSPAYRYNTDSILLADFARKMVSGKAKRAVDLGSGNGILPLFWCNKDREEAKTAVFSHITAVEIQKEACELACRSVAENDLEEKISVCNADLRALDGILPKAQFHLVSCNPPYKALGTGIRNPSAPLAQARHEDTCTPEDVIAAAAKLLQFGGKLCMCQRPERLCDLTELMRRYRLEPKVLRLVQQRPEKAPKLFLLCAVKGGNPGLTISPTLFIEDPEGNFSPEMREIYGASFLEKR